MKVTKYPHRYTISLSPAEYQTLAALVGHAYDDLVGVAIYASPTVKRVLARERWQNGPLAIDVEVKGRGGWKG